MSKRKFLALVYHDTGWKHYAIHEALLDTDSGEVYWVGSKSLKKFDNYHDAVEFWSAKEKRSGEVDILNASEIQDMMDRVDYSDNETELNFED